MIAASPPAAPSDPRLPPAPRHSYSGIAALIGAVAVKKLGLLAVLGVFLLKAWKLTAIAVIGIGAAIRRFFRRGDSTPR
jgi:uncharacterized membrane-anchored protein